MKKIKYFFFIIILLFFYKNLHAYENYILYKVNNEMVTSYDLNKEAKYMLSLNPKIQSLNKDKLKKISTESIINEKIKKIELEKYFKLGVNLDDPVLGNIIKNLYNKLGITEKKQFESYLLGFDLSYQWVSKKIEIESLWNNLIYEKYNNKLTINIDQIKNDLKKELKLSVNSKKFNLSEILVKPDQQNNEDDLIKKINESIKQVGFNNTANLFSSSDSAKVGGNIGWVEESSLSSIVIKELKNLEKGHTTKPIILNTGLLFLKVEDIVITKKKENFEEALNNKIIYEKNRQLAQFSTIYFNKIKQSIIVNEK
jgi:peptidyl-prolyl cis-trans isomerase SurA